MTRRFGLLSSSFILTIHSVGCGGKSSTTGDDSDAGASGSGVVRGGSSGSAAGGASGNGTGGSPQRGGAGGEVPRGGSGGSAGSTAGGAGTSAGGNAGNGGALGGAPAGGRSGSAGVAGVSGSSGSSGSSGGEVGQGGVAGSAGSIGVGRECETAEDCVLVSDCCSCETVPARQSFRPSCDAACEVDQCTDMGIAAGEVECTSGRCVVARSCDLRRVECAAAPPTCAPGFVPSVHEEDPVRCWGPCLPATECDGVTDCAACPTGSVCVSGDVYGSKRTCIVPPADCNAGSYCECLAPCAVGNCVENGDEVGCVCLGC